MNLFKIGIILITSLGFGIGVDQYQHRENDEQFEEYQYGYGQCHGEEPFLHMLENMNEEDRLLVEGKIEEMLLEYDITIEQLFEDYDLRYEFMNTLMDFIEANDIEIQHRSPYNRESHRHMMR